VCAFTRGRLRSHCAGADTVGTSQDDPRNAGEKGHEITEDQQLEPDVEGHIRRHGPEHNEVVTDGASESERRPPCANDEDGPEVEGHRYAFGTSDAAAAERRPTGIRPEDDAEPADGRYGH
jgi:hypothetical protein